MKERRLSGRVGKDGGRRADGEDLVREKSRKDGGEGGLKDTN